MTTQNPTKNPTQTYEYGMLVYDIPDEHSALGNYIRCLIRPHAIRINLSVYLIRWDQRSLIETIMNRAHEKAELKDMNGIRLLPFGGDINTVEVIRDMARVGLGEFIKSIESTIHVQVEKARKLEMGEIPPKIQRDMLKKLADAHVLAVTFALAEDVQMAMEAAKLAVAAQITAETWEKIVTSPKWDEAASVIEDTMAARGLAMEELV